MVLYFSSSPLGIVHPEKIGHCSSLSLMEGLESSLGWLNLVGMGEGFVDRFA